MPLRRILAALNMVVAMTMDARGSARLQLIVLGLSFTTRTLATRELLWSDCNHAAAREPGGDRLLAKGHS